MEKANLYRDAVSSLSVGRRRLRQVTYLRDNTTASLGLNRACAILYSPDQQFVTGRHPYNSCSIPPEMTYAASVRHRLGDSDGSEAEDGEDGELHRVFMPC